VRISPPQHLAEGAQRCGKEHGKERRQGVLERRDEVELLARLRAGHFGRGGGLDPGRAEVGDAQQVDRDGGRRCAAGVGQAHDGRPRGPGEPHGGGCGAALVAEDVGRKGRQRNGGRGHAVRVGQREEEGPRLLGG